MPNSADFGYRNVYVGEFGMPENHFSAEQMQKAISNAVETALDWGCPYIVYWQLYCNELKDSKQRPPVNSNDAVRGFWLIRPDGTKAWTWHYFYGLLNNLYVSPVGNDSWSGTLPAPNVQHSDGPFKTLTRARDAIRMMKQAGQLPDGGVTVCIRGGLYSLTKTFQLTAEDSGTHSAPIVYRAYKDEEVRLIGGVQIPGTVFQPVVDPAILKRIDKAAHGKVLQTDIKALGIANFGEVTTAGKRLELFFQNRSMTLARWPNKGFVKIAGVTDEEPHAIHGLKGSKVGKFFYEGKRPRRWSAEKDIWLHGYWFWDWRDAFEKVQSIDTEHHLLSTVPPYHGYGYRTGQRFYALNLLAELDTPGEWYLDRQRGILYFWPPAGLDEGKVFVSVMEESLISLENA